MNFTQNKKRKLRTGFSTGSCAAACAKGAALLYQKAEEFSLKMPVLFPDHNFHILKLKGKQIDKNRITVNIIKDAGDDPDVTDKAEISCSLQEIQKQNIDAKDFVAELNKAKIILRGGDGVGYVTRGGLDVPKGKWAINPVPRQMILDNLRDLDFGNEKKYFLFEISVKKGEELAKKTLNPLLGIKEGISILGISGLVVPYSNSSYIETIRILVRNAALNNLDKIVFCTGSRTHHAAKNKLPDLPEEAFIRMADFVAESLKEAGKHNFKLVIISCMPGKLFKYAQGFINTHAHKNSLETCQIEEHLIRVGLDKSTIEKLIKKPSVREIIENLSMSERNKVLDDLACQALKNFKNWLGNGNCAIYCFDYNKELLGTWS